MRSVKNEKCGKSRVWKMRRKFHAGNFNMANL